MKKDSIENMSVIEKLAHMKLCAERIKTAAETKLDLLNHITEKSDPQLISLVIKDLKKFDYAHIALYEDLF